MSTGLERGKNKTKAHQFHQEREIMSQQNHNHDFWPEVEKVALQTESKPFLMSITMTSLAVFLKKTEDTNYDFNNSSNLSLYWLHKNEVVRCLVQVNYQFLFLGTER